MNLKVFVFFMTICLPRRREMILAKKMTISNAVCDFNREVFANYTIRIPNSVINADLLLIKPLVNGVRSHLSFELRAKKSKTFQSIFEFDQDYCSGLANTRNTLIGRWYQLLLKNSNYSSTCPIKPSYYYLHGLKIDGNLLMPFLTIGEYRIEGTFYYGKYKKNMPKPLLRCKVDAILTA